jgi:hypothetical protein
LFLLVSCLLTCCVNCVFLNFFLSLCTSFFRYTCFLKFFTRSSHSSFNLENQMWIPTQLTIERLHKETKYVTRIYIN